MSEIKEVKVSRVGCNGKKINLPKAIWEKMELNFGDTVRLKLDHNNKNVVLTKKECEEE